MFRLYCWMTGIFLLTTIQAFDIIDRLVYGEWLGKPGDKITQSLNLLFIVTSLLLFVTGFRRIRNIRISAVLALGLASFLLCSAVWSISPQASLRQGILYLCVIVGAIGIVGTLEANEFMDVLASVCCLAAVASLVLLVVFPTYAFGGEIGFRGIFAQKNVLGEAMAIGALASLHGLRVANRRRFRNVFILIVVTVVALKSESATSCLTIFAFFGIDAVIALIKKGGASRFLATGGIVLLLPVVLFAAASPESVLEVIGKDPTLTGRTDIWGYVIPDIYQRPWLGWGYVAFWSPDNPAAMEIADALHWFAPQAHNGILEMLLNVGLTGTALFIFYWARNVRLALRSLRTSEQAMAISCLLSCIGIILVGISETVLVDPFEASTSVFFITGFFCEKAIRLRRRRLTAASDFRNRPAVRAQATA
jgi:exopolysaccharide production protein ExoQ